MCPICDIQCINKVRDHCHKTGKYRGSACTICNLNNKDQLIIPVVFLNGKGYAFNLLFDEIFNQNNNKRKIKALPCDEGKTRTFRVGILKFMDICSFMGTYISKIAVIYNLTNKSLCPCEYVKA